MLWSECYSVLWRFQTVIISASHWVAVALSLVTSCLSITPILLSLSHVPCLVSSQHHAVLALPLSLMCLALSHLSITPFLPSLSLSCALPCLPQLLLNNLSLVKLPDNDRFRTKHFDTIIPISSYDLNYSLFTDYVCEVYIKLNDGA